MQEKKEEEISSLYKDVCVQETTEFVKNFSSTKLNLSFENYMQNGLTSEKAEQNIKQYGTNQIKQSKPKKWYNYFLGSLFSTFNIILIGIAIVLFYTDVILSDIPSYANIIVILVLVLVSTLLEFVQEYN